MIALRESTIDLCVALGHPELVEQLRNPKLHVEDRNRAAIPEALRKFAHDIHRRFDGGSAAARQGEAVDQTALRQSLAAIKHQTWPATPTEVAAMPRALCDGLAIPLISGNC